MTFDHVSFHFSDDPETPILSDVSFSAKPGETIGILGETGSGKTTLVNLIARFYDPTKALFILMEKMLKAILFVNCEKISPWLCKMSFFFQYNRR